MYLTCPMKDKVIKLIVWVYPAWKDWIGEQSKLSRLIWIKKHCKYTQSFWTDEIFQIIFNLNSLEFSHTFYFTRNFKL